MGFKDPMYRSLEIVEVVCTIKDMERPSYRVNGVVQRAGDRCRLPLVDAQDLQRRGKAQIIEDSEEML